MAQGALVVALNATTTLRGYSVYYTVRVANTVAARRITRSFMCGYSLCFSDIHGKESTKPAPHKTTFEILYWEIRTNTTCHCYIGCNNGIGGFHENLVTFCVPGKPGFL